MTREVLELDSRSLAAAISKNRLLVVPVGALEAHGPHLPLGADQIQAVETSRSIAERLDGLVAPAIPYGCCSMAHEFPGTVSLSLAAMARLITETISEFARMGFRRILVISGHAERGHMAAVREGAEATRRLWPDCRVMVVSDYDFVYELRGTLSPPNDGHGGLLETSRVLWLAPGQVGSDRPSVEYRGSPYVPGAPSPEEWPESVIGDTRPASPELGKRVQEHVLSRLEETVRKLLPA